MARNIFGHIKLDDPLDSIVEIESHLISTRCANLYRGVYQPEGLSICLWELRGLLDEQESARFISRMSQLASLGLPNCPLQGYGVDIEGRAFAIISSIDPNFLVSGNSSRVDVREAERRFTPCLQTVARLHSAGIIVGDLCQYSFVLDRSGRILFVGLMGDAQMSIWAEDLKPADAEDTVVPEAFNFLSPDQRDGNLATMSSDVFALGVLGYRLYGGKYPFARILRSLLYESLDYPDAPDLAVTGKPTSAELIPDWCGEVFKRCLHLNSSVRYKDAQEMLGEIADLRQKTINESETPLKLTSGLVKSKYANQIEGTQKFKSPQIEEEEEEAEPKDSLFSGFRLIVFIMVVLAVFSGGFVAKKYLSVAKTDIPEISQIETKPAVSQVSIEEKFTKQISLLAEGISDPQLQEAFLSLTDVNRSTAEKSEKIRFIAASEDPLAFQALVLVCLYSSDSALENEVQSLIVSDLERAGAQRTADILKTWFQDSAGRIKGDNYEAILKFADLKQTAEARASFLRQAYPIDPLFTISLVAAAALDSGRSADFQAVVSQFIGDQLGEKQASEFSIWALLLADSATAEKYSDEIFNHSSEFSEKDLSFLIRVLSRREDPRLRQVVDISYRRMQGSDSKKAFLEIIAQRENLPFPIMLTLINGASGNITVEDIGQIGTWTDEASVTALLILCAQLSDPEMQIKVFDTLAAKPLADESLSQIVQIIRNKYWDERAQLVPLVAAVGLKALINQEVLINVLDSLAKRIEDGALLRIILHCSNTKLISLIVDRYADKLNLTNLLELLEHPEKEVRIKAIEALKSYNDVTSLKFVLEKFKKEKDPEVIELYKQSFWIVAERYK